MKNLTICVSAATIAAAALATSATATVSPFTETFAEDNADWGTGGLWSEYEPLAWSDGGGPDGNNYVTATQDFGGFEPGPLDLAIFRGQDNYNSSDGAFFGDWLDSGVTEFSFWVRHDAPTALEYFVRFTPTGPNFPSMNYRFEDTQVQSGEWTQLSVEIYEDNPGWVIGGNPATTYDAVFSDLGKIQLGASVGEFAGEDVSYNFDLAMVSTTVPAPGALGLLAIGGIAAHRRRRTA